MSAGDKKIREVFASWKAVHGYNAQEAAVRTGIQERTWRRRQSDYGSLTLAEFRRFVEATKANPDDVWQMVTGRRRT